CALPIGTHAAAMESTGAVLELGHKRDKCRAPAMRRVRPARCGSARCLGGDSFGELGWPKARARNVFARGAYLALGWARRDGHSIARYCSETLQLRGRLV